VWFFGDKMTAIFAIILVKDVMNVTRDEDGIIERNNWRL